MTQKQDERDTLRAALADEQARLRRLELEQGVARARIAELGQRLEAIDEHPAPTDESTNQPTNEPRTHTGSGATQKNARSAPPRKILHAQHDLARRFSINGDGTEDAKTVN